MARARNSDRQAFEELIEPYVPRITSLCRSLVRAHADLDDAVQESLFAAWRSFETFEGRDGAAFSTWLHRVAYNATTGMYRRRRPQPIDDSSIEHIGSAGSGPEGQATTAVSVRWALNQIPDEFRAAVVLADQFGLPYKEIAEIQIVSESTVKSRVFRGRQALKRLLDHRNE